MLDASLWFGYFDSKIHHTFTALSLTLFAIEFLDEPHRRGSVFDAGSS